MAKNVSYVVGAVLVLVGVVGFFNDPVIGIFEVNIVHSLIHLIVGLILLSVAAKTPQKMGATALIIGVILGLVALIGLFTSGPLILGVAESNTATDVLNIIAALVLIVVGVTDRKGGAAMPKGPAGGMDRTQPAQPSENPAQGPQGPQM